MPAKPTIIRILPAVYLTALALAAPGAAAAGPAVDTDRACYLQVEDTTVQVRGSGFTMGIPFSVALDGKPLPGGVGEIELDGTMNGSFSPPSLKSDLVQRRFRLGLETLDGTPTTSFTVTRLLASFWPNKGSVQKLKVRFSLFGFGLGGPVPRAYVHYIAPNGKRVKTVSMGKPTGQCGAIPKTKKQRLFPLKKVTPGIWRLQFDTHKKYSRGTSKGKFLYYTVKVRVRRS